MPSRVEPAEDGVGAKTVLAEVLSGVLVGVECVLVRVEVCVADGLPSISIVGLPQGAVKEGRDRVRAALQAAGYRLPPRRITVNLAPADLRKDGSGFDLPLALGLLAGSGLVPIDAVRGRAFVGELGLNGEVRPVRGTLAVAAACRSERIPLLVVPRANANEAAAGAGNVVVVGVESLDEVVAILTGKRTATPTSVRIEDFLDRAGDDGRDLADVRGHVGVKRALEVAAAGGHNLLMLGPPGSGKTMLARRLPGILPPLTPEEALEVTTIHSVAGLLPGGDALVRGRPFRSPHHSVSRAGLAGGGAPVRPGELSLAHHGVLFLDELPEFARGVLEALRQPMEDGWISVIRARERLAFPARFMLVAAMNPCSCGHLGDLRRACTCDPTQVARYRARISGPLRDRIDIHLEVPALPFAEMARKASGESSLAVRRRVCGARETQRERQELDREGAGRKGVPVSWNAALGPAQVRKWCGIDAEGERLLEDATDRLSLSPRGIHRVLKVARTVADLDRCQTIREEHLAEAVQYREVGG